MFMLPVRLGFWQRGQRTGCNEQCLSPLADIVSGLSTLRFERAFVGCRKLHIRNIIKATICNKFKDVWYCV